MDDSLAAEEVRRRVEIEQDPMRWILDVLESAEWDARRPPPDLMSCERVEVEVAYGGRVSRESCEAICTDVLGYRWRLKLSVSNDAGGYWEQPGQEVEGDWKREGQDMDEHMSEQAIQAIEDSANEQAAPVAVPVEAAVEQDEIRSNLEELSQSPLRQFARAREALRGERARLVAARETIDRQIVEIDAALAPSTRSPGPKSLERSITGPGSTQKIRKLFIAAPKRRVTYKEVAAFVGSTQRAGAFIQNLIKSGQVRRLKQGAYEATDKLVQMAAEEDAE